MKGLTRAGLLVVLLVATFSVRWTGDLSARSTQGLSNEAAATSAGTLAWNGASAVKAPGAVQPPGFRGQPFYFEANRGQTDARVRFIARTAEYTVFITPTEAVLALSPPSALKRGTLPVRTARGSLGETNHTGSPEYLRMRLVGANPTATLQGRDPLSGKVNYFHGNDPQGWRANVPTYSRVQVEEAYPGIDLVYYGSGTHFTFDVVVAPDASPGTLRLAFDGVERAEVDARGDLRLATRAGELSLPAPVIYQEVDGVRRMVPGRYVLHLAQQTTATMAPVEVGIEVQQYDRNRPLVIDPVLVYSTYLGGTQDEAGHDVAVDMAGYIYVTGSTTSADFPTANAIQPQFGGGPGCGDVFVAKLTPDGQALIYATYLGGSGYGGSQQPGMDCGRAIAVDSEGHAYVTGNASSGFPLVNPLQGFCRNYQPDRRPCHDGFIAKLAPDGSLQFSTYLGGGESDTFWDIAVDSGGYIYVAGGTSSPNFPTVNAWQGALNGLHDAVIVKLNPEGAAVYSTLLGGSAVDGGQSIGVDADGNAYVLGGTESFDFPIVQALQPAFAGGINDLFVAKLDATGTPLYATYLGGSGNDGGEGEIAVDAGGYAYVADYTTSTDFPIVKALQPTHHGGTDIATDGIVAKLNPDGSALVYSTYVGGTDDDACLGIAVDAGGFAYITGFTKSEDFPVVKPWQPVHGGGLRNSFVSKLTPTGSALVFSTFLGESGDSKGFNISLGASGDIYVTGETEGEFPTVNPLQPNPAGLSDAFISRFAQTLASEIAIAPAIVAFGAVPVGGSRTSAFVIHNTGDEVLSIAAISGIAPPVSLLGPLPPFSVMPGVRVPVFVRWTPAQPGTLRQMVRVESDDPDEPIAGVVLAGRTSP